MKIDPIEVLAQAADDTKSPGAWRSIMNAIYYLRAGRYSTLRSPGVTHDLFGSVVKYRYSTQEAK